MPKKIYDIKPPRVARKVEDAIKSMGVAPRKRRTVKPETRIRQKERRFPLRELIFGGVVIVLLLGVYVVLKLPKADIEIWPKLESFEQSEKVLANKSATSIDGIKKIIPAQYLEESKDAFQEFAATGSASNEGKATGTIKVYNKISPASPLTLKVGTHFLSDSGKYFVTLSRIVIPAMQGKTAGSISVKVQAEESGPSYNIGASKFSVPGLSGTSYYYNIWAESSTAMTGGYTGSVKKVTNADITNAKDTLTKKLLAEAEASLRAKLSPDQVLLDNAITKTVIEATSSVKADTVIDKFNETAKVKVSALVFKKQDLEKLAKDDIVNNLPEGMKYLESSLDVQYAGDSVDIQGGVVNLTVKVSAKKYHSIDTEALIELASQKSATQIQDTINSRYGADVSQVKVNFWPFWVHSAPSNKSRITVELRFE